MTTEDVQITINTLREVRDKIDKMPIPKAGYYYEIIDEVSIFMEEIKGIVPLMNALKIVSK